MDGKERLCLAQISNTLLKDYSYNEIHNRRVALGITCVQCTPVQVSLYYEVPFVPLGPLWVFLVPFIIINISLSITQVHILSLSLNDACPNKQGLLLALSCTNCTKILFESLSFFHFLVGNFKESWCHADIFEALWDDYETWSWKIVQKFLRGQYST